MDIEQGLYAQVVMISRKGFYNKKQNENKNKYNYQVKSKRSICWFNLDHEWLEENFRAREPDFYKKLYQTNIWGQETKKSIICSTNW